MKTKKALKRLTKVEALLSNLIQQCPNGKTGLSETLESAKDAVVRAKKAVRSQRSTTSVKKPAAKATNGRGRLSAQGRERISLAAKKRWAAAKRKGINAVTGRQLSRTA